MPRRLPVSRSGAHAGQPGELFGVLALVGGSASDDRSEKVDHRAVGGVFGNDPAQHLARLLAVVGAQDQQ